MSKLSTASSVIASSSFELIRSAELNDYQGTGLHFRHKATGLEIFFIKNDDREMFASFNFSTPPDSDNGKAHILEHTVLSGSRRFPVKDPFLAVSSGSVNTFMNAMTMQGCTSYPFATVLEKDFFNIFEVYSDAVFAPLLRKETFLLEGIRQDGDGFSGVVFNEMKGSFSDQESLASFYSQSGLFKGTPFGFAAGGMAVSIPDLTYEEYLESYKKWYHPSNCLLFLYGNLDIGKYMDYLDENYLKNTVPSGGGLTGRARGMETHDLGWNKPFEMQIPGPDAEKSSVLLSWATKPESDSLELITLSLIVDALLGDPGYPLYRAITESDLGEDLSESSGMGTGFPLMPFSVGFSGADRNDAHKIEGFLMDTLAQICRDGIDRRIIEASLKAEEFSLQEIQRGYYPIGYTACQRALRGWLAGKGPFATVGASERLARLKQALAEDSRYLEHWIERNLLDNPHRMLLVVYPDKDFEARIDRELESKLSVRTPLQLEEQRALLQRFSSMPDDEGMLSRIGHVTRADIRVDVEPYPYERLVVMGQDVYKQNMFTNGICYFCFGFDTCDLSEREHLLLPLLLRLLQMTGVGEMDFSQAAIRLKELCGGLSMGTAAVMTLSNDVSSSASVTMKTLPRDCNSALEFLSRMILEGDLTTASRIKAAITDGITDFKAFFTDYGSSFAARRAASTLMPHAKENELCIGISQWDFLRELSGSKTSMKQIASELEALRSKVFVRERLTGQFCCSPENSSDCLEAAERFIGLLPSSPCADCALDHRFYGELSDDMNQTFLIPGQVAYNALAIAVPPQEEKERMAKIVLGMILSDRELWTRIRSNGGAYMGDARMDAFADIFTFTSYRDPRISGSFSDFRESLEAIAKDGVEKDFLESEVVTLAGRELRPLSPGAVCAGARRSFVQGLTDEMRRRRIEIMLGLDGDDIAAEASKLLRILDDDKAAEKLIDSGKRLADKKNSGSDGDSKGKVAMTTLASKSLFQENHIDCSKSRKIAL